ncbi:MAG: DUF4381 domain-containing protein [Marinobacter sp.]|uniref:DUF4381 domain-containing protein n=1 Tax=Marinobacter sp. TaxID=50741 RepID=UPI00299DA310|nr:DUF4381 domain-containing protein [Marinobacter sp.]MDX1756643.1 DUF4381 domain-containing protein [Marinobacter sp.]
MSQLRDIHLPEPGGFWPPAPGWWALALIVMVLVTVLAIWLVRKHRRNRWIALALAELDALAEQQRRDTAWFVRLNELLKRSARHRYPDRVPEALSGQSWIDFLLETSPRDRIAARPVVAALVASSWQPRPSCNPDQALAVSRQWLRGQRC